jgi:DNA polymerase alpha subunit A
MLYFFLGLDGPKFHSASNDIQDTCLLSIQMNDADRFKDVEKPTIVCIYCKDQFLYDGVIRKSHREEMQCGLICPSASCNRILPCSSLLAQLIILSRGFIQKYYDAYFECDEPTCRYRTRKIFLNRNHHCP